MEEKVIICNNLSKKFGDFVAVDKISFDVKKGEIFGFLGANGAVKLQQCACFAGFHTPPPVKPV